MTRYIDSNLRKRGFLQALNKQEVFATISCLLAEVLEGIFGLTL